MLASLRVRLLLLTLFVAGIALATVAVLSRQAVRSEYLRLEMREGEGHLSGVAALLAERIERAGGDADPDSILERAARSLDHRLLLVGPDGRVSAASSPALRAARVEAGEGGRLAIENEARVDGVLRTQRTVVVGGPRVTVRRSDGTPLGTLYALPGMREDGERGEPGFVSAVNRWLLFAAIASGGLALLLTLALSRHILGPVEALTAAARRMAAGDLSQRVAARSRGEIGELARTFNAMADALEGNEALRRNLVSDVAHELRTPLTNLRCQIEAVQDGLRPADLETMRSLHEETLLLGRLVADLQDLALAESGRLPLHRGPVPVGEAIEAALAAIRPLAVERGIALRAELEPAPAVDADRERLGQILRNLLANAVTHTPAGGSIAVTAHGDGDVVSIAVHDTGAGIPPEHLLHVFDRFYRADPSRTRTTGGAGLGLAIVKQLVEAHGGRVGAESEPGRGATFTFTLPSAGVQA